MYLVTGSRLGDASVTSFPSYTSVDCTRQSVFKLKVDKHKTWLKQ